MDTRLGRAARDARIQAGATLMDVSTRSGVSQATLSRFERNGGWPDSLNEMIDAYARVSGVKPAELWRRALEAREDA